MIVMKKRKSTFCKELLKDLEKNFKIFEKIAASDWLKINMNAGKMTEILPLDKKNCITVFSRIFSFQPLNLFLI
jgi:hypothetical protein